MPWKVECGHQDKRAIGVCHGTTLWSKRSLARFSKEINYTSNE